MSSIRFMSSLNDDRIVASFAGTDLVFGTSATSAATGGGGGGGGGAAAAEPTTPGPSIIVNESYMEARRGGRQGTTTGTSASRFKPSKAPGTLHPLMSPAFRKA